MTTNFFGRLLGWGRQLEAKPWAEQIAKSPEFGDQIINKLQEGGISKDMIGEWARWYEGNFAQNPSAQQFRYRAEGLQQLYERYPGPNTTTPAAAHVWIGPIGAQCS